MEEIGRWWAGVVQFAAKYNIVLPEYTIDSDLFIRAEEKKVRRAGGRTKGPSAFTDRDRRRFVENLEDLLGIW